MHSSGTNGAAHGGIEQEWVKLGFVFAKKLKNKLNLRHSVESETSLTIAVDVVSFDSNYIQKEGIPEKDPVNNEFYTNAGSTFVKGGYPIAKHVQVVILLISNINEGWQKYETNLHKNS